MGTKRLVSASRGSFSRQRTPGKEPLLVGKLCPDLKKKKLIFPDFSGKFPLAGGEGGWESIWVGFWGVEWREGARKKKSPEVGIQLLIEKGLKIVLLEMK